MARIGRVLKRYRNMSFDRLAVPVLFCLALLALPMADASADGDLVSILSRVSEDSLQAADEAYQDARDLVDRSNMPTEADYERAIALLKSAASKGHVLAMHDLAVHLEHGIGTKQDLADAFRWYRVAAQLGFAGSQNNLGDMFERGQGVAQSFGDAVYWYSQAAMQGDAVSFFSLGNVFLQGRGVSVSKSEAAYWLTLAVAHLPEGSNLKEAQTELASVKGQLTPQEMVEVELRARLYEPLKETGGQLGDRPN